MPAVASLRPDTLAGKFGGQKPSPLSCTSPCRVGRSRLSVAGLVLATTMTLTFSRPKRRPKQCTEHAFGIAADARSPPRLTDTLHLACSPAHVPRASRCSNRASPRSVSTVSVFGVSEWACSWSVLGVFGIRNPGRRGRNHCFNSDDQVTTVTTRSFHPRGSVSDDHVCTCSVSPSGFFAPAEVVSSLPARRPQKLTDEVVLEVVYRARNGQAAVDIREPNGIRQNAFKPPESWKDATTPNHQVQLASSASNFARAGCVRVGVCYTVVILCAKCRILKNTISPLGSWDGSCCLRDGLLGLRPFRQVACIMVSDVVAQA